MSEEDNGADILIGKKKDVRTLVEWQQQRYHHLQNISLALLSGFLTVLAILATILSPSYKSIFRPPVGTAEVKAVATNSIFSYLSLSFITGLSYLLSFSIALLAISAGVIGCYKLYVIISNPPLQPELDRFDILELQTTNLNLLNETDIDTVQQRLRDSYHLNKEIIKNAKEDFRISLLRLPASLLAAHYAIQLYFHTTSLNIQSMILYDCLLILPASLSAPVIKRVFNSSKRKSTPTSIGQEILKGDGGRFPNKFIGPEKWFAKASNLIVSIIIITALVDLAIGNII